MRITIAPKIFFGFIAIIFLNVFFFVIVSNLENITNITNILKRQNEIKSFMVHLRTRHRVQSLTVTTFERLGRQESVDRFSETQNEIIEFLDSIQVKLDSIIQLQSGLNNGKVEPVNAETFNNIVTNMSSIRKYNDLYATMFDNIVHSKNQDLSEKKTDIWREELDKAGERLTEFIDTTLHMVDDLTHSQIKEVEIKVGSVKEQTKYILIMVTVLAMLFATWFSTYITTSLRRLTVSAGNIGKGDFDVDPHGYPSDEIGDLASAFFQMSVDLKNVQEALVRSKRLAAIGEVVASVNHEINNPLMIISGNAQFLQMMMKQYPEEMKERVQTILEETERISQVTRKLREIKNPVVEDYTSSGEQMINLDKSSS